jgi:hypothetical protein
VIYRKDAQRMAFALRKLSDELKERALLGSTVHQTMLTHHIRVCTDIATVLMNQNPKLDRAKFLEGCGV